MAALLFSLGLAVSDIEMPGHLAGTSDQQVNRGDMSTTESVNLILLALKPAQV